MAGVKGRSGRPVGSKATTPRKVTERATREEAAATFTALCNNGETPEAVVLRVMRGAPSIPLPDDDTARANAVVTDRQYEAAKALLPYRLPRLNAIDATNKNVDLTHEQWLAEMERDHAGNE